MIGVTYAWVVKITNMPPDLMPSSGLRLYAKQGTSWLMAAAQQLDRAAGFFQEPVVILHWGLDLHGFFVFEKSTNEGNICLFTGGQAGL